MLGGIAGNDDTRRDFERAGHADALDRGAGLVEHLHRTREQEIGDVVVIARLDDQDARAFGVAFLTLASPRPSHRLTPVEGRW